MGYTETSTKLTVNHEKVLLHRARYKCDDGFVLSNSIINSDLVCQNGEWIGSKPTCREHAAITCAELTIPRNAERMQCTDGDNLGSTCAFECRLGYKMVGDLLMTCRESSASGISVGVWDGIPPLCRDPLTSIYVQSAGEDSGSFAGIEINGINRSENKNGFNIAVIRHETDEIVVRHFDVSNNAAKKSEMMSFLSDDVGLNDVVIMSVSGNAEVSFLDDERDAKVMKNLGVGSHERCPLNIGYRESWCMITQKLVGDEKEGTKLPAWFTCDHESRYNGRIVVTADISLLDPSATKEDIWH